MRGPMSDYFRRRRAFVVDADPSTRADYGAALTAYGFDVFESSSAADAHRDASACEPDVVIVIVPEAPEGAAAAIDLLRRLQRGAVSRAPVLVVAPESQLDDVAALLDVTGGLVVAAPARPLDVVLGARK